MGELAEYKGISLIRLTDGDTIQVDKSPDEVLAVINSGVKFVKIGGKIVNVNIIGRVDLVEATDIDLFLLGITDTIIRDRMKAILEERKNKGVKTNGVQHLIQIYEDRHGKFGGEE